MLALVETIPDTEPSRIIPPVDVVPATAVAADEPNIPVVIVGTVDGEEFVFRNSRSVSDPETGVIIVYPADPYADLLSNPLSEVRFNFDHVVVWLDVMLTAAEVDWLISDTE